MSHDDNQQNPTPKGNDLPGGSPAPAQREPLGNGDILAKVEKPVRDLLFPIFLIVLCTLIVGIAARWNLFNCNDYTMLILSYSLLFGAGGVVLGGALRVGGQLKPFGAPWTVDAAGGVAAAVLAGLVAYSLKPACTLDWKLEITDLPLSQSTNFSDVKTFATVDFDSNNVVMQKRNNGTLSFNFSDAEDFKLSVRLYRAEKEGYKFLATCEIAFQHASNAPDNNREGDLIYWLQTRSPLSLSFNSKYFDFLADADRNSAAADYKNLCLSGFFSSGNQPPGPDTAVTPLKIVRDKLASVGPRTGPLRIFFTKTKPAVPPDSKAAAKEAVKADLGSSNELLTPSGTGSAVTAAVKEAPPATVRVAIDAPSSCLSEKDANVRLLVDSFLNGNDLEKKERQEQIYPNWPDINCYVLPIAVGLSRDISSLQQSRAVKLLINAIINNSTQAGDPFYWQPDGPRRRDFRKQLPYLREADIQRIFDLIPSEEALLRAEALRFVKLLPVDALDRLFKQKLSRLKMPGNGRESLAQTERFAVAAVSLYYNRIVEWLDGVVDSNTRGAIQTDFAAGSEWAVDNYFNGRSAKPYEATLLYAKGIVEREQKLTDETGNVAHKATFTKMLARLKQTSEPYPLRSLHLAQALAFVSNIPDSNLIEFLRQIQQSDPITPALAFDDSSAFAGKSFAMYAAPKKDASVSLASNITTKESGNVLLRLGDWSFIRTPNRLGWIAVPRS